MKRYRLSRNYRHSREWRRGKFYSEVELKWLARRKNLEVKRHRENLQVLKGEEIVAEFNPADDDNGPKAKEISRRASPRQ